MNISEDKAKGLWIARMRLRLKPDTDEYADGFRGGFTTVLVRCDTATQFLEAAETLLALEGFLVEGVEKLYPLLSGEFEFNELIQELVNQSDDYQVQWTSFHLFKGDA